MKEYERLFTVFADGDPAAALAAAAARLAEAADAKGALLTDLQVLAILDAEFRSGYYCAGFIPQTVTLEGRT